MIDCISINYYHLNIPPKILGASLKDLGRKVFAFSRIDVSERYLRKTEASGE